MQNSLAIYNTQYTIHNIQYTFFQVNQNTIKIKLELWVDTKNLLPVKGAWKLQSLIIKTYTTPKSKYENIQKRNFNF